MKDDVKNVTISVKTNDKLKIEGSKSQNINFSKKGEKYVNFDLAANSNIGVATIEVTAVSGDKMSKYDIELDVKYLNEKMTDVIDGIKDKESFEKTFNPIGIAGTNEAVLEIYSIPPLNLEKRLNFLIQYPHGCIEQITSGAFPQLYLETLTDLTDRQKEKIQENIRAYFYRLPKYQTSYGGFSYWAGGSSVSDWGTNYAGHFMLEAEKMGYSVPANVKSNWLKYQKERATKWTNSGKYSQIDQAYRLYTLALAGSEDRSAMNRLKEQKNIDNTAAWLLASAYSAAGKQNISKEIIAKLNTKVDNYIELDGNFGSSLRDRAMILNVLTENAEKEKAFMLLKEISEILGSNTYCNTQATAYSLMAISKYVKKYAVSQKINCTYTLNGKEFSANTQKSVFKADMAIKDSENQLIVKSNNSEILYIRIALKGIPEAGEETDASSNITMSVTYTNLDGDPIDVRNLYQGTDFIAIVKLRHNSTTFYTLKNVALTQIFPSGWEIINSRMYATQLGETSYFDYQDIRDDRVLTYFEMYKNSEYTYKVMLSASYAGEYYLPAVVAETMYDNSNYARRKGMFVKVTGN